VRAAQSIVRDAVRAGVLSSAHDIAEGGLAVALAECCLVGGLGAEIEIEEGFWETLQPAGAPGDAAPGPGSVSSASTDAPIALTTALFGEGPGGFIVSGEAEQLRALQTHAAGANVAVRVLGRVGEDVLNVVEAGAVAGTMITVTLRELGDAHGRLGELFP
jgi:phosphoribosylformylglycinamidine (FGAM) synthase-like enzyme